MDAQDNTKVQELFDAVGQFIGILDGQGTVINANRAALELTGLSPAEMTGQPLWEVPWRAFSRTNKREVRQAFDQAAAGNFARLELEIQPDGQPGKTIDFSFTPVRDDRQAVAFVIVSGLDISSYKKTSEALAQSNVRFATIFEKAGIGIVIKAPDGKIIDCNPAFLNMLGYDLEELRGRNYLDITHPADRPINRKLFNELQEGKRESYNLEKRYLCKTREVIWVSSNASLVRGSDRKAQFIIVMAENITVQKLIEAEVVELRQRLMLGRETERLKLAQDLHDGPLQELIGISYQLKELDGLLQDEAGREQLQATQAALQQVSRSIRLICSELRPSTLIPFGLEKAILSHSEEFRTAHPELSLELDLAQDGQDLNEQIRINLFRIYQEALNNVLRHSNATRVFVHFWLNKNQAILEIKDDGKGFKLPEHWIELARMGHLGLAGSIERARDVGGHLEVSSAVGKGTKIRAVIPLRKGGFPK
jgi:PAS domain S-box-containing protein